MAKRMKTITAGPVTKTVVYSMPAPRDPEHVRAAKRKASTAARRAMNYKSAVANLELLIAANFGGADLFCSLTYDDEHLPGPQLSRSEQRAAAKKNLRAFIARVRAARQRAGLPFKYIYVTEGLHGDKRLHHHIIINAAGPGDMELIKSQWVCGFADVEAIRHSYYEPAGNYINYEKLARYMAKERPEERPNGAQMWTRSRNLARPEVDIVTVPDDMTAAIPPGVHVIEHREERTEYAAFAFLKYIAPERPAAPSVPQTGRRRSPGKRVLSPARRQRART